MTARLLPRVAAVAFLIFIAFGSPAGPGIAAPHSGASAGKHTLSKRTSHVPVSDMWIDVSLGEPLVEWFNQVARPTDIARIEHVALIRELDQITAGRKLVVFKSAADASQAVPVLRDRMDIIGYNLEAGPGTPVDEQANPVASIRAMQNLARANNMLLAVGPDRNFALTYGVAIAPYVDIFVIQVQRIQMDPESVRAFVIPLAEALRQANPNIQVSVQVRTEGDVVALADLIDSMRNHLDGVSILTSPETTDVAHALVTELRSRGQATPGPATSEPARLGTPTNGASMATPTNIASTATPGVGDRTTPTESVSSIRKSVTMTPYPVPTRLGPLGAGGVYIPWWILALGAVVWAGVVGVVLIVVIIWFHGKNKA